MYIGAHMPRLVIKLQIHVPTTEKRPLFSAVLANILTPSKMFGKHYQKTHLEHKELSKAKPMEMTKAIMKSVTSHIVTKLQVAQLYRK